MRPSGNSAREPPGVMELFRPAAAGSLTTPMALPRFSGWENQKVEVRTAKRHRDLRSVVDRRGRSLTLASLVQSGSAHLILKDLKRPVRDPAN